MGCYYDNLGRVRGLGSEPKSCKALACENVVAEWIDFTLFGIILPTITRKVCTFWDNTPTIKPKVYTFWDNTPHFKTKSVHFLGLMNSATK